MNRVATIPGVVKIKVDYLNGTLPSNDDTT